MGKAIAMKEFLSNFNTKWTSALKSMTFKKVKEAFQLFRLNLRVKGSELVEFFKVVVKYYAKKPSFAWIDLCVIGSYIFRNPYSVSKRFLLKTRAKDIHAYGETPLSTLEVIAERCKIGSDDVVYELGSGRGRTCFWLRSFCGCQVVGIEHNPTFVKIAKRIVNFAHVEGVEFREEDMCRGDYSDASVVYLYGTCMNEKSIKMLIENLQQLKKGTKIITVSYSLADYTDKPLFEVMNRFPAQFTWGVADVYVQYKI